MNGLRKEDYKERKVKVEESKQKEEGAQLLVFRHPTDLSVPKM